MKLSKDGTISEGDIDPVSALGQQGENSRHTIQIVGCDRFECFVEVFENRPHAWSYSTKGESERVRQGEDRVE
jgi:hypothetical protein